MGGIHLQGEKVTWVIHRLQLFIVIQIQCILMDGAITEY